MYHSVRFDRHSHGAAGDGSEFIHTARSIGLQRWTGKIPKTFNHVIDAGIRPAIEARLCLEGRVGRFKPSDLFARTHHDGAFSGGG
jgi:hypothetical protein